MINFVFQLYLNLIKSMDYETCYYFKFTESKVLYYIIDISRIIQFFKKKIDLSIITFKTNLKKYNKIVIICFANNKLNTISIVCCIVYD